jgi:hypothetical protein
MPLDRIDELAVAPLLTPHVRGDDRMQRRHQPQHVKKHAEKEAGHDQRQIEAKGCPLSAAPAAE